MAINNYKLSDQEDPTIVIEVKNLSKEFKVSQKKSFFSFNPSKKITILKNINFTVKKGEYLGIIGLNGAGKTTLLRLIAKILIPTTGEVEVKGKTTAFLEMGIGFHNDLTIKENIYLHGAFLGLPRMQINNIIDKIYDFSGLQEYKDIEYRELSFGKKTILAIAMVIFTNADILLMDETLTFGDKDFQKRCYDKFWQFKAEGKTVLIASHNTELIKWFCDKTLLIDKGEQIMFGNTNEAVDYYLKNIK